MRSDRLRWCSQGRGTACGPVMALGCGAMAAELADATGAFEGSLPGGSVDWMEVVVRHEDPVWKTGYWCSDARWVFPLYYARTIYHIQRECK